MTSNKIQLTQRVWEQLSKLQIPLYISIMIGLYISSSINNDAQKYKKLIEEIADIRHAYKLLAKDNLNQESNTNIYYFIETTYYENRENNESWFYRSNDLLKNEINRYLLVHSEDIDQFSYTDSFLWGENFVSGYEVFKDDVKNARGEPIKWYSSKYKDIENVRILDIIHYSDELFQPQFYTPHINDLFYIGAYKRDLSNGKQLGFGAISYIIKERLKLTPEEINNISSTGKIQVNGFVYPVVLHDVTNQNYFYKKENDEYHYLGVINFGIGNVFGLTDYADLSSTFSSSRYLYDRGQKSFKRIDDSKLGYFKDNFPLLHEMFFIDYEKKRNPKVSELETEISKILERKEKISIPLIGISFHKGEAGKVISMIISVLWILILAYLRRLKDIDFESLPIIEIPHTNAIDLLILRMLKIVLPFGVNAVLITLVIENYKTDVMTLFALLLVAMSFLMFCRTYMVSKKYWILVRHH